MHAADNSQDYSDSDSAEDGGPNSSSILDDLRELEVIHKYYKWGGE